MNITNYCLYCNSPIYKKQNKFCNKSCAATYNNKGRIKTQESKLKISKTLKQGYETGRLCQTRKKIWPQTYCEECNGPVHRKGSTINKFCSRECYSKSKRIKDVRRIAGKKSAQSRVKRSKNEMTLFNFIVQLYPEAKSNYIIADGWDADIVLPENKIAILWNGPWHYKELNIKGHSLSQVQNRDKIKIKLFSTLGWNVLIFEDRFYTPERAFQEVKNILGGFRPD